MSLSPISAFFRAVTVAAALVVSAALAAPSGAFAQGPVSVADLAERLIGAVVNISTRQNVQGQGNNRRAPRPQVPEGSPFQDYFDEFFNNGPRQNPRSRRVQSLGSGFVIDPAGIIITNQHVIADADEITVEFADGKELVAEVVGADAKTDIAVLKVTPPQPLQAVPFGDSKKARVGDWVMAIGNPFGQGSSVSLGIVSAINRDINSGPYDNFIQTDAAINRGNSGGPLFNMAGEVIGINTAIISPSGGSIGLGFSIPSRLALGVIDQLREFGETRRGWLGVSIQPVNRNEFRGLGLDSARGARVAGVTAKGPAEIAGIKPGDVILEFDGKRVQEMRDLPRIVADTAVGKNVDVVVMRDKKEQTIAVVLGRLEDGERQIAAGENGNGDKPNEGEVSALGMTFAALDDETRKTYSIGEDVKGVVVTSVESGSQAEQKGIKVGSVVTEVGQEGVEKPEDIAERLAALEKEGRKKLLFLVSAPDGQLSFVVLNAD